MKWRCAIGFVLLVLTCINVVQANAEEEQYIVYLKQRVSLSKFSEKQESHYIIMDKDELSECLSLGIVEFYEPDYEIKLLDDFALGDSDKWNIDAINTSKAWSLGCYGNAVKVAVIDSGVYPHPDIVRGLLNGYNYVDRNTDTSDNIGHGTYVSGIIAAECNDKYITGIAHKAKIIPLKCFDIGKSTRTSMISDAIYDAVDVYQADVINMSLGMREPMTTRTLQLAINYAIDKGCIVVTAVGNDGKETVYYPANYNNVIGVGSVNSDLELSWFSQHNSTVDVVAPGSRVESISIEGYDRDSGTSFACPHVSAMAAIAKCIDKSISAIQFQSLLRETSTDLGTGGYDVYYGYGLINVEEMINKMLENTSIFMSPVDEQNKNIEITIYNNSYDIIQAVGIVAEYEDVFLKNMSLVDIILQAKETVKISKDKGRIKFMLWDNFYNLKPLHMAREYISDGGNNR